VTKLGVPRRSTHSRFDRRDRQRHRRAGQRDVTHGTEYTFNLTIPIIVDETRPAFRPTSCYQIE
jgi:hypothetical protein